MGPDSIRALIDRHPTHATCDMRGVGLHRLRQNGGPPGELTLDALQEQHGRLYEIGWLAGIFWAIPLFPGAHPVGAETLEGLDSAIRAQLGRQPDGTGGGQ